jgi:hypothetical protein
MPCWSSNVKAKVINEYEFPKLKAAEEISYRIPILLLGIVKGFPYQNLFKTERFFMVM